jgi:D-alanyl-D-alanine carboxypeptidase/D-alanyl-D-alanine-endopeptidase (penicillin-binding protein 4)
MKRIPYHEKLDGCLAGWPRRFFLALVLWTASLAHAGDGLPVALSRALARANIPTHSVSVFVQDVSRPFPTLNYRADQSMNPASVIKLLTTYAALELLGPAYQWKTEIYTDAGIHGDALPGNLIIKGYGDPSLSLENLWSMLHSLRQQNIRVVRGDLVIDNSFFNVMAADPAAFDNEPLRPYNVQPDALLINFKTLSLRLMPDSASQQIRIVPEHDLPKLEIVNALFLDGASCNNWRDRLNPVVTEDQDSATLTIYGNFSLECGEKMLLVSLFDHPRYNYGSFKQLWQELGGSISGGVRLDRLPQDAQLLLVRESRALAEVVRDINKNSNNVMARNLLLTISAELGGAPGTVENATALLNQWLALKGLHFPELVLENGAGLSRIERISAKHLGQLLLAAYHSPVMSEFMASLPIAAVDGTMQNRLKNQAIAGSAHIKTGALDGVKTMAGYVLDRKGRQQVVVFMINHGNSNYGQAAQDTLLEWVYSRP